MNAEKKINGNNDFEGNILIPLNIKDVFLRALRQSLKVSWVLIKIYIPLSLITTFLRQIGLIDWIAPFSVL